MSSSEAGPSKASSGRTAPEHAIPSTQFYAVEFPGYVSDSPASVSRAVEHLGGQAALERAFRRNASRRDALLELSWRPGNPFAHPVPGTVVGTQSLLVKVVKRRRKRREGEAPGAIVGEMVVEPVGVVPKTVRFRSMADFQYQPDTSDPIAQLRFAMDRMDAEAIKNFEFQPEKADYGLLDGVAGVRTEDRTGLPVDPPIHSPLRLFPPPVFSRQVVPHVYNYKASNMSVVTTVVDPQTGIERKRLINKARWKGYGPTIISFAEKKVPEGPPQNVLEVQDQADKQILEKLKTHFNERPIWTRSALMNMFPPAEVREIQNGKILIPLVCYAFSDGPWRDTMVRFGYDPRTDPSARFYQRLYFRNVNHPIARPSVTERRQEQRDLQAKASSSTTLAGTDADAPPSHVFDGVHLRTETAAFQLCDITDPMLKEMIEDEAGVRDECNERDGWYTTHALERIKTVLRHKFFSLLDGHVATREECEALLDPEARTAVVTRDAHRFQPRKHNMAKGALPPEDAAAARLRAALDSSARAVVSRGR